MTPIQWLFRKLWTIPKDKLTWYTMLKKAEEMQCKDLIVQQVLEKFIQRSETGIKKYGTTLQQNNDDDYLNHLQEELMDAILYIQKLKQLHNEKTGG